MSSFSGPYGPSTTATRSLPLSQSSGEERVDAALGEGL